MPNQVVNTGIDMGVGRIANMALGRYLPILPDFYNSRAGSVGQGFRNSQANAMLHGNGQAWKDYGLRAAGGAGGFALGGPIGAAIGSRALPWIADKVSGWFGRDNAPMPQFSSFGPYASGYQGLPEEAPEPEYVMPNFSNYGDYLAGNTDVQGNPISYGGGGYVPFGMSGGLNNSGFGSSAMGTTFNGAPMSAMASIRAGTGMSNSNMPGMRGKVKQPK